MIQRFETRQEMAKHFVKPGMHICEIGIFMGDFARYLNTLDPAELVLIDPFEDWCYSGNQDGNNGMTVYLPMIYEYMKADFEREFNIKIMRGLSGDVLPKLPDNHFDFMYIDGDHSYLGVKRDLLLCAQKIKSGGIIAGHDYAINKEKCLTNYDFGVQQAVNEFCAEHGWEIIALAFDGCVSFALKEKAREGVIG